MHWDTGTVHAQQIGAYRDLLLKYNQQVNLISRQTTPEALQKLLSESLMLSKIITGCHIVDAGSGNGILGIPLAIVNPDKKVFLVESRAKKAHFLRQMISDLGLRNIEVCGEDIMEFFKGYKNHDVWVCARGFPDLQPLVKLLKKHKVKGIAVITSTTKIKKNLKTIEKHGQKIYNIPFRDKLKILKLENVSRET